MDIYIFFSILSQSLQKLTLTKSRTRTKQKQREYYFVCVDGLATKGHDESG
jgi:hypothetical protein